MRSPFYMLKFSMQVNKVMFDTGQNTGVGSLSLLQGIKTRCPTLQVDSLPVEPQEKPIQLLSHVQLHGLYELAQTHVQGVILSNHLILCRPLLLLPSIFPSIRVFSNESALCIKWRNYWRFSCSISPSIEYSGSISFRIDWFDLSFI